MMNSNDTIISQLKNTDVLNERCVIHLKSDTLSENDQQKINVNTYEYTLDLCKREVYLTIIESNDTDFFKILNNLFADTNISVLIERFSIRADNNLEDKYPHYEFQRGKSVLHNLNSNLFSINVNYHMIGFKFTKLEPHYNRVKNFFSK